MSHLSLTHRGSSGNNTESVFGYDLHIALATRPTDQPACPELVLGISLDRPGVVPGLNAAHALVGIKEAGLPIRHLTVDLGYSQLLDENFALPVRALGYQIMQMYKPAQYGQILAQAKGLIMIEGRVYGPCLPAHLRWASKDLHEKRIDEETYHRRLEERRAYEARLKNGSSGSTYVFRCPGAGSGRTVRCDWKQVSRDQERVEANGRRRLPIVVERPANQSDSLICSNSASVSVAVEEFARYESPYPFRTPEWVNAYRPPRQKIERLNREVKDPTQVSIKDPGERRFRGWGKQFFVLLIKIVAANFFITIEWITDTEATPPTPVARARRGRPKKKGLEQYAIDPNGPPARIVGFASEKTA